MTHLGEMLHQPHTHTHTYVQYTVCTMYNPKEKCKTESNVKLRRAVFSMALNVIAMVQ